MIPIEKNLIDIAWGEAQPERISNKVFSLDLKFCGVSIKSKWEKIRKQMEEKKTEAIVVSALDEIACK